MANKHVGASLVGARNNLRMEQKFKKTPAGEIPMEWAVCQLGELCNGKPEYGANVSSLEYQPDLPRYVRITDIMEDGSLSNNDLKSIKKEDAEPYILSEGDFVFARSGATVGKTYLHRKADGECAFAGYLIRFKPDRAKLLPEYLFQVTHCNFYYQWVQNMFHAGAQPNINATEYAGFLFPLPPLPEQQKIAEILSSVDEAIEKTDAVLGKTKHLKKGLMQKLLTRGIGHKKFKKTEIGEIPAGWEVEKLGELCLGKPEYGANVSALDYKSDLPRYVRITDINEDGSLSRSDVKSIKNEDAQSYLLSEGDFLFARSGATVGKTYLYQKSDGECAFAGYLIRFKPDKEKLLPEFLFQFTHSQQYYNWVNGMLHAGAQPNINATEYSDLLLPIPSVDEQNEILSILSAMDKEISNEKDCKQNLEQTKKSLMQVLLTGRVRVKS